MFCYQCQETMRGTGCNMAVGVCGKTKDVAELQDLLIMSIKRLAGVYEKKGLHAQDTPELNRQVIKALFMTITNANFDEVAIMDQIKLINKARHELEGKDHLCNPSKEQMLEVAKKASILLELDEDIRSLKEFIVYGIKGMAAYLDHGANLGFRDWEIEDFIYRAMDFVVGSKTQDELIGLLLETGDYGVKAMALLDKANTQTYGNPRVTKVDIGVRHNPAILITGHDLKDLELLLEQTQGTGVDVYTHGEMLPAHYYPFFSKYPNFAGNYGNAWWKQTQEFKSFEGPVLYTTNCIVPPKDEQIKERLFTTGAAGCPGFKQIGRAHV